MPLKAKFLKLMSNGFFVFSHGFFIIIRSAKGQFAFDHIYIYIKHSEMTKIILKAKILKLAPRAFHYFIMVILLLSGQLRDNLLFD
jgi:hypothetical protein